MSAINAVPDANVRSQTYYVARATAQCGYCGSPNRLLALAMPRIHETLEDEWQCADANAFLFYVGELPDDVRHRLQALSPHFRRARSAATQSIYWANHCEHCGTLLGDHELHCEPDGAFAPSSEAAAADIELLHINAPLRAAASGYALEPEFFRFMRGS
jgi:hypothetical protein